MPQDFARKSARRLCAALFTIGFILTSTQPASASTSALAFVPITRQYLELPKTARPQWPTFTADGKDIIFQNFADFQIWMVGSDGNNVHCITCDLADRPKPRMFGFAHALPDGKRLLITDGVAPVVDAPKGSNGWILECAVSLRECTSHKFLPVDMTTAHGGPKTQQRRTWHLSPDGKLIGWMEVRTDATVMIVARLERKDDKYVAADPRVVNPIGPHSDKDSNADRWENLSQLYELKSFTPDGKAIIAVGTPNNNVDVLRIELADGRTTRLTAHPDWDEDSSLSPDQSLLVVNSWRGADRLDALAWIPEIRGFSGLMMGAAIAPYYVSTWEGFQCDLSPWLLPARGDDDGRAMGQPLDIYGGDLTASNNIHGQRVWSPDSTKVILNERSRTKGGAVPSRIAIAVLDREPSRAVPSRSVKIGKWAVPAKLYDGPHFKDRVALVKGKAGGTATIAYTGTLGGGGATTKVTFKNFTDDGKTFVSGTMSGAASTHGEGEQRPWVLLADITVTGKHTGRLEMNLLIDNSAKPLPAMTGTMHAIYDGKTAPPLPQLGPCYDNQAKASPLEVKLSRKGNKIVALVTANIKGDRRPVRNALVTVGRKSVKTDSKGKASLSVFAEDKGITVTAGDTFLPSKSALPLP